MLVIKVWCLPKMTEKRLRLLHLKIVGAAMGVRELRIKDQNDMVCLFPKDMMSYGLGEEIVIEAVGLFAEPCIAFTTERGLAKLLTDAVWSMFPKASVQCFVYPFSPMALIVRGS